MSVPFIWRNSWGLVWSRGFQLAWIRVCSCVAWGQYEIGYWRIFLDDAIRFLHWSPLFKEISFSSRQVAFASSFSKGSIDCHSPAHVRVTLETSIERLDQNLCLCFYIQTSVPLNGYRGLPSLTGARRAKTWRYIIKTLPVALGLGSVVVYSWPCWQGWLVCWFWFLGTHSFPGIDGFCQVFIWHSASTHWAFQIFLSWKSDLTLCFVLCWLCSLVFKIWVNKPVIVSLQTRTIPFSFLYPSCYYCQSQCLETSPGMINRGSETRFVPSFLGITSDSLSPSLSGILMLPCLGVAKWVLLSSLDQDGFGPLDLRLYSECCVIGNSVKIAILGR